MSTVIAKNQTAGALALTQIPVPDNEIPASGQVTLTDFATISEIQDDAEIAAHIAAGDAVLNVDGVDLSAADSAAWAVPLTVASIAEVDTGTDASKAVSPAALAGSDLASDVTTNNAKVSNANHTGDVTGATALTIAANAVTLAKMATVATARFLGRVTAGVGAPEALTGTQATTLLDQFTSALQGVVPGSGGGTANFLRADGTWAAPPGGGSSPLLVLPFGAKLNDLGKFSICNGKSSDADNASAPRTRAPIPVDGTLTTLAYQTQTATSATTMKVHVNGAVEATVALANINANKGGTETISVSVSAGDYVELEFDSGDDPGESIMYLTLEAS